MAKIFYFCGDEQFQPEILVEHAQIAEEVGFDGIMISDHFHPWVCDQSAGGFVFSTLGAIAQATTRIEMITGVTVPIFRYHPGIVAQAAATLDRLSNGRFMLGIGTGESINELPLGFTFPSYAERSKRLLESIEIMKRLLAGERVTFDGAYYHLKDAKLYSPPTHGVPIYMAASGEKSAAMAASFTDGLITSVKDIDQAATFLSSIHPAPKTLIATKWTIFGNNTDDLYKAMYAWRGMRMPSRDSAHDPLQLQQEADSRSKEELIQTFSHVDSADAYMQTYGPLISTLHADIVVIQTSTSKNQEEHIRILGSNVLPKLKAVSKQL